MEELDYNKILKEVLEMKKELKNSSKTFGELELQFNYLSENCNTLFRSIYDEPNFNHLMVLQPMFEALSKKKNKTISEEQANEEVYQHLNDLYITPVVNKLNKNKKK